MNTGNCYDSVDTAKYSVPVNISSRFSKNSKRPFQNVLKILEKKMFLRYYMSSDAVAAPRLLY